LAIVASDWTTAAELMSRARFHLERAECRELARNAEWSLREIAARQRLSLFDPTRN
jgi:hypothetical protein